MKSIANYLGFALRCFAVSALVLALACGGKKKLDGGTLTVKGSDTMVNLASAWAEAYMKAHPDAVVSVDGGGSGTGIAALLNGTVEIASASRNVKQKELELAKEKGIVLVEHTVARDAISVVVNPANPVSELTMAQLAKIYTGEYTSWSQVGGPNEKITVCSRENTSGTYAFFQEHVLQNKDYAKTALLLPANTSIVDEVASNSWAIGYIGLGYLVGAENKVKALGIKADASSPAVMPSEQTAKSGEYSIARALYLYTVGEPQGLAKSFIEFVSSEEGQKIVVETGFVTAQ